MDLDTTQKELIATAALRLECFEKLLSLAKEQRSILVEGRHADLEPNLCEQDRILVELGRLDRREDKLIGFINEGSQQGKFLPNYETRYGEITQRIKNAVVRLRSVMRINTELLENVARYVSFSLAVIAKLASNQSPHSRQSCAAGTSVLLDGKA